MKIPNLTNAEFELMDAIWKTSEPMSTNEIIANLDNHKNWKTTTVLTLMGKLIEKGYVRAVKTGRAYQYYIVISQEQYQRSEGKLLLRKLYNNSLKNFVASLYEEDALSEADVHELMDWFESKNKEPKGE